MPTKSGSEENLERNKGSNEDPFRRDSKPLNEFMILLKTEVYDKSTALVVSRTCKRGLFADVEAVHEKAKVLIGPKTCNHVTKNVKSGGRGLSKYFSGKSQSFQCMADATCVEDLKKPELPIAKRRKYSKRKTFIPPVRCAPCLGV
ncbi:hypothetical protein QJS10_CPB15g01987 [Acorus calamus]|uniref:Uncharacterized protein n=1 Tax=Acorus calamus TaxID=4465 RepID=A0AAV9D925_ACOCL|nr:hypothetical protein QJS10_CPB15g01987 [Acorus calamus]